MPSEITLGLLVGMAKHPAPQQVMESLTQVQVSIAAKGKSGFDLSFAVSKSSPIMTDLLPPGPTLGQDPTAAQGRTVPLAATV